MLATLKFFSLFTAENLEEKMDIDVSDAKVVKQRSTSDKVLSMAKKHLPPNDAHVARSSSTSNVAYHSVNGIHHTSSKLSERAGVSTYLPMDHNHFAADRQRNSTPENYHPISVKLPKRGSENALCKYAILFTFQSHSIHATERML